MAKSRPSGSASAKSRMPDLVVVNLRVRQLTDCKRPIMDHLGIVDRVVFPIPEGGFAMAPRLALLSFILALGVSVAFATVTTVRQVHQENASAAIHAAHS